MSRKQLHKIEVAIYDSNKEYLERLSKFLMSSDNYHFSINSFSNETYLTNFLKTNHVDILLFSVDQTVHTANYNDILTIFLIGDHHYKEVKEEKYIYKYQSAFKIERQIIKYYSSNTSNELVNLNEEKGCQLIGIYSPAGGCGKTTLSIALGKALALQDHKTLFLSLEEYPSYGNVFNQNVQSSLSDLLYHIRKKTDNLMMKLEGIKATHGESHLDYIPPPIYSEDITDTKIQEFVTLFENLKKYSSYEFIIIDFTSDYSKRNQQLFQMCQKHFLLTNGTSLNIAKVEAFIHQKLLNEEDKKDVVLIVNSTTNHNISNQETIKISELNISYKIPYIEAIEYEKGDGYNRYLIEAMEGITERIINEKG